jgi:ABC-type uncharacterized transport system permease subunit
MIERFLDPRFIVTAALIALFSVAYIHNQGDEAMKGALITAFAAAYGFWLGSSKGAQSQTDNVGKALDLASSNAPPATPDVMLKPGETARAEEQPQ